MIEDEPEVKADDLLDEKADSETVNMGIWKISLAVIEGGTKPSTFKVIGNIKKYKFHHSY